MWVGSRWLPWLPNPAWPSPSMADKLVAKLRGNRITPVAPETTVRDPDTDWRLATLVFVNLDQARHPFHICRPIPGRQNLGDALIFFHIHLHDRVQHLVGRQGILVGLIR